MVLMMWVWFCKLMLVLVSSVKKVNKLLEVLTLLSVNSNSWSHCSSSTVVRPTEEIPCLSFITSIRTSYMWCHNSTSDSSRHSQDNHCMSNSSIKCTISPWPPSQFSGTVFTISNTRRILICKWNYPRESLKDTSWGTHCFTELELTDHAFQHGCLLNG